MPGWMEQLPWKTRWKYEAVELSDEESHKTNQNGHRGKPTIPRLLIRLGQLILAALLIGVLAHVGYQVVVHSRAVAQQTHSASTVPSISDLDLALLPDTQEVETKVVPDVQGGAESTFDEEMKEDEAATALEAHRTGLNAIAETLPTSISVAETAANTIETHTDKVKEVDWSKFAYCQYVTNHDYLCNSLMIFEALFRLESKAERLMMYPEDWALDSNSSEAKLLQKARDEYGVKLAPIHVQHFDGEATWGDSFTKLLAFNQTQYERVISLDSDANVLQPMDELFSLPDTPVAMPRAYWLDNTLSSQFIVIQPSKHEFSRIREAFASRTDSDFDMEIVNNLYADSCLILPHRRYDLLTGEFRGKDHHKYLGSKTEKWDPKAILKEAKFLHFSDWPFPKPWLVPDESLRAEVQPACHGEGDSRDCSDREVWNGIYREFTERRQVSDPSEATRTSANISIRESVDQVLNLMGRGMFIHRLDELHHDLNQSFS